MVCYVKLTLGRCKGSDCRKCTLIAPERCVFRNGRSHLRDSHRLGREELVSVSEDELDTWCDVVGSCPRNAYRLLMSSYDW